MRRYDKEGEVCGIHWYADEYPHCCIVKFDNGIDCSVMLGEHYNTYMFSNGLQYDAPKDVLHFEPFHVLYKSEKDGDNCTVVVRDYEPSTLTVVVSPRECDFLSRISIERFKTGKFACIISRYIVEMDLDGNFNMEDMEDTKSVMALYPHLAKLQYFKAGLGGILKAKKVDGEVVKLTNGSTVPLNAWVGAKSLADIYQYISE